MEMTQNGRDGKEARMELKRDEIRSLIGIAIGFPALFGGLWWFWGPIVMVPAITVVFVALMAVVLGSVRRIRGDIEETVRQTQGLLFLNSHLDTLHPLPALGGAALTPDSAATLVGLIKERRPKVIVELGSGVSTVVCAQTVKQLGEGRIISLDHDKFYAGITRQNLQRHGLEEWAEVQHAPIEPTMIDGEQWQWYATSQLPADLHVDLFNRRRSAEEGPAPRPVSGCQGSVRSSLYRLHDPRRRYESQAGAGNCQSVVAGTFRIRDYRTPVGQGSHDLPPCGLTCIESQSELMDEYTVVITSCGRFDLLERTLRSLQPHLEGPLDSVLVIEDSGNPAVEDVVKSVVSDARVMVNERQLGQLASIDRAYQTVRTPCIFHCEDDWQFTGGGFLEDSYQLLQEFLHLSLISLRPRSEINKLLRPSPRESFRGIDYFQAKPTLHPEYFGYSFNPGLRRLSDYQRIGPFASFRGERGDQLLLQEARLHDGLPRKRLCDSHRQRASCR